MRNACFLVWLTGVFPLWRAWQANRQISLLQAVYWAIAAWAGWGLALVTAASWPALSATASCYVALSLTGCAAIAVLGARRPGMHAWNFVVVALLAVDLLPLAQSFLATRVLQLNVFQITALAGTLIVGVISYLPTAFAPAALALLLGCALELTALVHSAGTGEDHQLILEAGWMSLVLTPWVAYASVRGSNSAPEFDGLWLDFRNRFGFVWGQRVREQFNRSAANSGWPVILRWQGLRLLPGTSPLQPALHARMLATLRALLKRFGPEEKDHSTRPEANPTESPR